MDTGVDMKIAIMSDSHDRWENLTKAIEIANKEDCELLLFAGDLIAPTGVPVLEKFNGKVKFVWGNNEGERMNLTRKMDASKKIELCGDIYEDTVDGIRIFMNHYPRLAQLAAKSGEFDLCVSGHSHEALEKKVGQCLLINSGSIQGSDTPRGFVIFDTKSRKTKTVALI